MNSRERVRRVLDGQLPDRCPIDFQCTAAMESILVERLALADAEALQRLMGSDFRVVRPALRRDCLGEYYGHYFVREIERETFLDNWGIHWKRVQTPSGDVFYDVVHSPLLDVGSVDAVLAYPFPCPAEDWDFASVKHKALQHSDSVIAGKTSAVFDDAWRLIGLENMMVLMHTAPEIVHAVLRKVCDYWLQYATRLLDASEGLITVMWLCDDLGTQNGLLISPELCRRFVIPLVKERADLFRRHGARVFMHCCGGIEPIIPDLIAAGIEALNPIQSAAAGMDRRKLKDTYGDRLVFHGSVDQQRVLVPGSVADVIQETRECLRVLGRGGRYILASSHEIEADIPVENVKAVFMTAQECGRYS